MIIKSDKKENGFQRKVARLVYMEPELWNLIERTAAVGDSRSDHTRKIIKSHFVMKCKKIENIEWSEV